MKMEDIDMDMSFLERDEYLFGDFNELCQGFITNDSEDCRTSKERVQLRPDSVCEESLGSRKGKSTQLEMKSIIGHAHMSLRTAAMKLGMGTTTIKRFCRMRQYRWPYCKVKVIDRMLKVCNDESDRGTLEELRINFTKYGVVEYLTHQYEILLKKYQNHLKTTRRKRM